MHSFLIDCYINILKLPQFSGKPKNFNYLIDNSIKNYMLLTYEHYCKDLLFSVKLSNTITAKTHGKNVYRLLV